MTHKKSEALWDISNQFERELIRITHNYQMQHGISDTVYWILYALHENKENMTQTDICSTMYAPRQSTNSALGKLEKEGLVKKIPVPGNQKSKYIVLTPKGEELAEQVVAPMKAAEQKTFAAFTEEEIGVFLAISKKRCEMFRELIERGQSHA